MSTIHTAPAVTLIPAKNNPAFAVESHTAVTRVAAYCRVSTEEENQQNSYATQVKYYTDYISSNPEWELVGIFADEGISGTGTAKRTEFNKMIKLCRRKKVDLILCKSISRFARNTVDCLDYVRELKALGINVKFEKENIETLSASSEFTISLYASFAQAESESISKNVTWGIEKAFQEGKVRYRLDQTLGYRMGADGKPEIVESEAEHIRWMFRMFADGHSMGEIATILTEKKIMRRNGETAWTRTNVQRILTNEKYVGDAILQKSYTVDCLTHERRKNSGEKTKYYLRDCHDAIIDRDTWDRVHLEFARRSAEIKGRHSGKKYAKKYCFSDLLTCPYCGGKYKRTIWKIGEKSVGVWRCGNRIDHGSRICSKGASLHENKLQNAVIAVVNDMIENPEKMEEAIMETMNQFRTEITEIDTQLMDISTELERISTRRDDILTVITGEAFEQFKTELKDLNSQELELKAKTEKLQIKKENVQFSIKKAVTAREMFSNMLPLRDFDDIAIPKLIERIDVTDKEHIRVIFCGGVEVEVTVEK